MPFFYTDSGSFNNLEVTGSTILSGSLIVSGATNFGPSGLTGSLFGTASYADSASYALTASYATNAVSTPAFPFSGSAVITGSLLVSGSGINVTASSFTLENQGNKLTIEKTPGGAFGSSITTNDVFYVGTGDYFILGETPYVGAEDLTGFWANDIRSTINVYGGSVGIGIQSSQTNRLAVSGSVLASSYTSSLNNQVGFFGTSSFAVSSSRAISASFAQTAISASYFSGSVSFPDGLTVGQLTASNAQLTNIAVTQLTASNAQLTNIVDTTATNKILVLNTATNQIHTTSSVGTGGGSGAGFPFNGSAVITGSLLVSGSSNVLRAIGSGSTVFSVSGSLGALFEVIDSASGELFTISSASIDIFKIDNKKNIHVSGALNVNGPTTLSGSLIVSSSNNSPVTISGSVNDFFELEVVNASAGNNASADVVVSSNNTTDFGNYASFGINSTTFNGPLVGGASDAYLYVTSSVGELDIGHAHPGANSNIRLFTNGPNSTANTRVFISASGNVGIGTATPNERLVVAGNQVISGSLTVSGSRAITATGSLTLLSSSLTINTGSISINTGSLTVDQLPGQTSGITLRVTGSNQVLYIGNDGQGSSFLKTNNTQLRFGGLGFNGFAWDGLSLYPETTDEENLGSTSNRWNRLIVNQVTASIVSASAGITGSLAQFNPVSLKLTVGTTAPTSPAVNDLWVDTN